MHGAAWARWPSRSSKPVRSGSPRLGRFDSCAAPLDESPADQVSDGRSGDPSEVPRTDAHGPSSSAYDGSLVDDRAEVVRAANDRTRSAVAAFATVKAIRKIAAVDPFQFPVLGCCRRQMACSESCGMSVSRAILPARSMERSLSRKSRHSHGIHLNLLPINFG